MEVEVNILNVEEVLEKFATDYPGTAKMMAKVMRRVLAKIRAKTSRDLQSIINNDTRKASKAVRLAVYKKILGGNISILDPKKASSTRCRLVRARKLDANPKQRGGNRSERTDRTEKLDSYYGTDRAFVLRFLNQGVDRTDPSSQHRYGNRAPGNRGVIQGRNFFGPTVDKNLEQAGEMLEEEIIKEFEKIMRTS